jgi:hypothetical protein
MAHGIEPLTAPRPVCLPSGHTQDEGVSKSWDVACHGCVQASHLKNKTCVILLLVIFILILLSLTPRTSH